MTDNASTETSRYTHNDLRKLVDAQTGGAGDDLVGPITKDQAEALITEVARLRIERLRAQVDDLAFAIDAEQDEVVRLRDGIQDHRDYRFVSHPDASRLSVFREMREVNERLWALLEDHDER